MLTTPTTLFPELARFRELLELEGDPVYVPVRPRKGSIPDWCTEDVARQVKQHGGSAICGWMIWHWPGIMAEATFHMVWRTPANNLIDVSAKTDEERNILFFPDPKITYTGEKIDTVRIPLRSHPLILDWIDACDRFDQEFVRQFGRKQRGDVTFGGNLAALYRKMGELGNDVSILANMFPR